MEAAAAELSPSKLESLPSLKSSHEMVSEYIAKHSPVMGIHPNQQPSSEPLLNQDLDSLNLGQK